MYTFEISHNNILYSLSPNWSLCIISNATPPEVFTMIYDRYFILVSYFNILWKITILIFKTLAVQIKSDFAWISISYQVLFICSVVTALWEVLYGICLISTPLQILQCTQINYRSSEDVYSYLLHIDGA